MDLESFDLGSLNLESLDLQSVFGKLFNQLDSLPVELDQLANLNQLFEDQLSDLSLENGLLEDLLNLSTKSFEQLDFEQMEGMMQNFMKDFESLNLDDMIDREEVEKLVEKHAKRRKI